jgi:hypothetical protein
LITHILNGLEREMLIGHTWGSANAEILRSNLGFEVPSQGLVWTPSAIGLELFMWAHGISNIPIANFLNPNVSYPPVKDIPALTGIIRKEKKPDQPEPKATAEVSPANRPAL